MIINFLENFNQKRKQITKKNNNWIFVILLIILVIAFFTKLKGFSIIQGATGYDTDIILQDNNGGRIFTPNTQSLNIVCPLGTNNDCGHWLILIDEKVYQNNLDVNSWYHLCSIVGSVTNQNQNITQVYTQFTNFCNDANNPSLLNKQNTLSTEASSLNTYLSSTLGTTSLPLSVGNHQFEVFAYPTSGIAHNYQTFTVINTLRCGDGICSPEVGETYLSCNTDCAAPSCQNGIIDGSEQGIDCGGSCGVQCNTTSYSCTPNFVYSDWSQCSNENVQTRTYQDTSHCGKTPDQPLTQSCVSNQVTNPPIISGGQNTNNISRSSNLNIIIFIIIA